ncbi:MAG: DNA topoisomerase IB [Gemmataceae bacterium]|nr:DNA topoisomerase IB [Gemmataceae bacterium]
MGTGSASSRQSVARSRPAPVRGLRYVNDALPGIHRIRAGKGFRYVRPDGKSVRQRHVLQRIASLAVPPAWTDVWICPFADGHLQAVGHDSRGRKQYRYHARWRQVRDATKYDRLVSFAKVLPRIRARTGRDLKRRGLPREKVLALVVRLLEATHIRIGNKEYVRDNGSFGLTTMHDKHIDVVGATMHFDFLGKGGIRHRIEITNRRLARILQRCQDLPGYELFQYQDATGRRHTIGSADVNAYIREASGKDFTAKDFRTWAGTVLAARALRATAGFRSRRQAERNILAAIDVAAECLGNTRSICRKCYVHPAIIDAYMAGDLNRASNAPRGRAKARKRAALPREEATVLHLLERHL